MHSPREPSLSSDANRRAARIRRVIEDLMARRAAGECLPDAMVASSHSDLMPELGQELAVLSMIERVRTGAGSSAEAPDLLATRTAQGRASAEQLLGFRGYAVVREIHRGGQGVVYEATQKSTGRPVAIKLLHESLLNNERDRARFEREARILGLLSHPNLVAIHDSGTIAGRHYLVMDLVRGRAIGEADGAGGAPAGAADIEATVRRFIRVCDAVNVAHLHGIIHRDLKPGNILVDASGEPRVLDFGLAKLTEDSALPDQTVTAAGQFVGSLPWASPEQAQGASDTLDIRSDVYSLGVILFQVLTGRFPYPIAGGWRVVADTIATEAPARPRSIRPAIPVDLERIILKCLAKEPARRYQSAGELGRDLSRYLAGEPIAARSDSTWHILHKLARKHRMKAAVAAVFLVVVMASAVVMSILYTREREALVLAEQERRDADSARQLAVTRMHEADAARQRAETEAEKSAAVNDFLKTVLASPDPMEGSKDVKVSDVLTLAAQSVHEKFVDNPAAEAAVRLTIAQTYEGLGRLGEAEEQIRAARAIHLATAGRESVDTIECTYLLASILHHTGNLDEAEALAKEIIEVTSGKLDGELNDAHMGASSMYAFILFARGRPQEAAQIARRNLDYLLRKYGPEHRRTISGTNDLATFLQATDQNDEAAALFQTALETGRRVLGPDHLVVQVTQNQYARFLQKLERFDEAEALRRQTLDLQRQTLPPGHPQIANTLLDLARLRLHAKDPASALELAEESLRIRKAAFGEDHPQTALASGTLANILMHLNRFEDAEAALLHSFEICRMTWGQEPQWEHDLRFLADALCERWQRPDKRAEWEARFNAAASTTVNASTNDDAGAPSGPTVDSTPTTTGPAAAGSAD